MSAIFRRLAGDESGQDLVEYALLVGLVALLAAGGIGLFGTSLRDGLWGPVVTGVRAVLANMLA